MGHHHAMRIIIIRQCLSIPCIVRMYIVFLGPVFLIIHRWHLVIWLIHLSRFQVMLYRWTFGVFNGTELSYLCILGFQIDLQYICWFGNSCVVKRIRSYNIVAPILKQSNWPPIYTFRQNGPKFTRYVHSMEEQSLSLKSIERPLK